MVNGTGSAPTRDERVGRWVGAVGRRARRMVVEVFASIAIAVRGIVTNRMRAFLSTIGIAIGVATLMTIYGLVAGLTTAFTSQLATLGSDTMYVTSRPWVIGDDWWRYRNRPPISREDVAALRRRGDLLTAVAPVAITVAEASYRGEQLGAVRVYGTNADYLDTSTRKMASGRFLSPLEGAGTGHVTVIGSAVGERLFKDASPLGARIALGPERFTVVGVLVAEGNSFGRSLDDVVMIPLDTFGRLYGMRRDMAIRSPPTTITCSRPRTRSSTSSAASAGSPPPRRTPSRSTGSRSSRRCSTRRRRRCSGSRSRSASSRCWSAASG